MDQIYQVIGICPQYDCLWEDLTVEEHFIFFTRLRGIKQAYERSEVEEILKKMNLEEHADKRIQ